MDGWFVDVAMWVVLFFYVACFIPQIIKNIQLRSTHGLSQSSILTFFVAHTFLLYYTFLMNLLLPYKVVAPLQFVGISIIVVQRFYYHGLLANKWFLWGVISTFIAAVFCVPLVWLQPILLGKVSGWIALSFFTLQPIPQIIKVHKEKSVHGFSFGFVTLIGVAAICECIIVLIKGLPVQTLMMTIRSMVIYLIFCVQFWRYKV